MGLERRAAARITPDLDVEPARRAERPDAARPGRTVVVAGDTAPARSVLEASIDADLLVHEATFLEDERARAEETAHSTAVDAAQLAQAAGVRMLALTHLSTRYFGPDAAREARAVFPETVVPRDFDIIDVRFQERGGPQLIKGGALPQRGVPAPVENSAAVSDVDIPEEAAR